jgi:hypothetical protein
MSIRRLIGAAPIFDEVTEISIEWFRWTMDQIAGDITVVRLEDGDAVKATVENALASLSNVEWFTHYDHGNEYVMWGDDEQPIFNLDNLHKLAGLRCYMMNCLTGKGLGPHALDAGILEFLGYRISYAFTTDTLEENKLATAFGLIKAVKENLSLKDVAEPMRQNGYDIADDLRAAGNWIAAATLVRNMNNLVVYCATCPPPPEEEDCPVSNMILKLFGRRALGYLRRLRQKLFPEKLTPTLGR